MIVDKLVRFRKGGNTGHGILKDEMVTSGKETYRLDQVELLAPAEPSKVVCIGLNYVEHARELKMDMPEEPILFLKPPSAVIGPRAQIIMPKSSSQVDYEGELGVVIGRRCRSVTAEEAVDYVLGYTCFNDVTARDLQRRDGQWTRAKSFDTFAPFGPWVVSMDIGEAASLRIETRVNGRVKQSSRTDDLIFGVPELIEFISGVMTLMPGDVIATGTPPGVGPLTRGDLVEVEVEGIGTLRNPVV